MIYCSNSWGNPNQTQLGLAIGIPLGVILLLGVTAFVMIRRYRGRQSGGSGFHTPATAPAAPASFTTSTVPLTPFVAPSSPTQLGSALSSVGAPPPYRSPTSQG